MSTEIWRPVVGWEVYYEVSNLGNVRRSLKTNNTYPGRVRKPCFDTYGYPQLILTGGGKRQGIKIHRAVVEAFLPPDPGRPLINHKDGNTQNNRLENLERCTNGENKWHSYHVTKRSVPIRGEKHAWAKLTEADVLIIRRRYANGETQTSIGRDYGMGQGPIGQIVRRENWKHI